MCQEDAVYLYRLSPGHDTTDHVAHMSKRKLTDFSRQWETRFIIPELAQPAQGARKNICIASIHEQVTTLYLAVVDESVGEVITVVAERDCCGKTFENSSSFFIDQSNS